MLLNLPEGCDDSTFLPPVHAELKVCRYDQAALAQSMHPAHAGDMAAESATLTAQTNPSCKSLQEVSELHNVQGVHVCTN